MVLGSSFTGLLISHALARRGIAHTVIGGPRPPTSPRLGESVSEGAALACWDLLGPVYRPFFHEKSHVSLSYGELASLVRLATPGRDLDVLGPVDPHQAGVAEVGARLVHLDRARLDPMLYEEVREHPACTFIEARARELGYDLTEDRITSVRLDDGRLLEPAVLFDATGYRGMVAGAVRLVHRPLGRLRRMVWLHRYRDGAMESSRAWPWWRRGTNLVRLERQHDGIDGLGWMIPLGDEVSLGLDVDAQADGADAVADAMLVDELLRAFTRRGMPVAQVFPRAGAVRHATHRHYLRERAHGANWLLAGTAFGRVWSPASSSLETAVTAAYLAPAFLESPERVGARYEAATRERLHAERRFIEAIERGSARRVHELYAFWASWRRWVLGRSPEELAIAGGLPPARPPSSLRRALERSELLGLATSGFVEIEARRIEDPAQWDAPFGSNRAGVGSGLRSYARGWVRYLGSAAARAWRGEPGSTRALLGEESSVVTGG